MSGTLRTACEKWREPPYPIGSGCKIADALDTRASSFLSDQSTIVDLRIPRISKLVTRACARPYLVGVRLQMPSSDAHGHHFALASLHTTASHTIGVPHLVELFRAVPSDAPHERYREAVLDENVLGRPTQVGRQRSLRHLRELYLLDPTRMDFAALRRLWDVDSRAQPLIAGLLAFTRDGILRASFAAIQQTPPGGIVTSDDLTKAVTAVYGVDLSESTLGKTGRNTGASWTQTGHLSGRTKKVRQSIEAFPAAVAYAAYLGHLAGKRGAGVLDTPWAAVLDLPIWAGIDALRRAHTHGLLDLLVAGNVVDVSFPVLEEESR